jgi:hypothetical protein
MSKEEDRIAAIEKTLGPVRGLFDGLPHAPDVQELEQRFREHEREMRGWVTNPPPANDRATLKAQLGELMMALVAARRRHGAKTMPPPPVSVSITAAPPAVEPADDKHK